MAEAGGSSSATTESTVSRYLRQLGDDIGADTTGGKVLKVSGTIVSGIHDWQLSLASNSNLDDLIWRAARIAWKAPIPPRASEIKLFKGKIEAMLTIDNDKSGNLIQEWTFRSRSQPLILMRLLAAQNWEPGPWLATLVAAVHAGASKAVYSWARQELMDVCTQGATHFQLKQDECLLLMEQTARAAKALVDDLQAVAINESWRRIPKATLTQHVDSLPLLRHRGVVPDWWADIFHHYDQYEMPMYQLQHKLRRGIEYEGEKLVDTPAGSVVLNVSDFLDWVRAKFVHAIVDDTLTKTNEAILEPLSRQFGDGSVSSPFFVDYLFEGLDQAASELPPSSRVVILDVAQNLAGLCRLGEIILAGEGKHSKDRNAFVCALCASVSGSKVDTPASGTIVCIQTPVGLFILRLLDQTKLEETPSWQLQAIHLDHLSNNTAVTYEPEDRESNDEIAGVGPMTYRELSVDDVISGVVVVQAGVLKLICLIRGELFTVNFGKILERLLELRHVPGDDVPSEVPADLLFAYVTSDLVLRNLFMAEYCAPHDMGPVLILTGGNVH